MRRSHRDRTRTRCSEVFLVVLVLAGCGGEPLDEDETLGVLRAPIVGGIENASTNTRRQETTTRAPSTLSRRHPFECAR